MCSDRIAVLEALCHMASDCFKYFLQHEIFIFTSVVLRIFLIFDMDTFRVDLVDISAIDQAHYAWYKQCCRFSRNIA